MKKKKKLQLKLTCETTVWKGVYIIKGKNVYMYWVKLF